MKSSKHESSLEILVCPQTCGEASRPCIKKCCSLDKVYSFGMKKHMVDKGCFAQKGDYFKPHFYDDFSTKSTHDVPEPFFIEHYPRSFKELCPTNRTVFYLFPEAVNILNDFTKREFHPLVYRIRDDGKIVFKHAKDGGCSILDPEKEHFCIDGAINYGGDKMTYINEEREVVLFLCALPTSINVCSHAASDTVTRICHLKLFPDKKSLFYLINGLFVMTCVKTNN